jgi:hypothetical protein
MGAQWEYRVVTFGSAFRGPKPVDLEEMLNETAADSWELEEIFILASPQRIVTILRRPIEKRQVDRSQTWP